MYLDILSKNIYKILKQFITKKDFVLEFGSSIGYISFELLKEGYQISMLDMRATPIEIAKETAKRLDIETDFYRQDFLKHENNYDVLWNSGCIQCCTDDEKDTWIKHCRDLAPKLILFWPHKAEHQRDRGRSLIKGFNHAEEYDTSKVEDIVKAYFNKIYGGYISNTGFPYNFEWIYGENEL